LVKKKKFGAKALEKLKSNPHKMLSTILVGNNIVNTGAAAIATLDLRHFGAVTIAGAPRLLPRDL